MLGRIMGRTHLVLGLVLGLYIIVMSATGMLILFREEIQAWRYPAIREASKATGVSAQQAIEAHLAAYADWQPFSITWPSETMPHWMIFAMKGRAAKEVYIDRGSGKIVAAIDPSQGWLGAAERIHSNWGFGRNGRLFNGYAGWGTILLTLSGLWLLIPRLSSLRNGRLWRNRPLHYLLGLASLWFVLGIAFTGTYYTWGAAYRDLSFRYFGHWPAITYPASSEGTVLPFDKLIEKAQSVMPGKPLQRTGMPDAKYPFRVTFREGNLREFHKVSTVVLNPITGEVLATEKHRERPAGNRLVAWLAAFHAGAMGGRAGQGLWALMSAAMVVLAVTGFLIWWKRR